MEKDSVVSLAMREKHWGELTLEEKVERTRIVVRNISDRTDRANNELYNIETDFDNHNHIDGKVVVERSKKTGGPVGHSTGRLNSKEDLDKTYF